MYCLCNMSSHAAPRPAWGAPRHNKFYGCRNDIMITIVISLLSTYMPCLFFSFDIVMFTLFMSRYVTSVWHHEIITLLIYFLMLFVIVDRGGRNAWVGAVAHWLPRGRLVYYRYYVYRCCIMSFSIYKVHSLESLDVCCHWPVVVLWAINQISLYSCITL